MIRHLLEAGVSSKSIDVYEIGKEYWYQGIAKIRAESVLHDVQNCGYHITFSNGERLFYATDTATLSHVNAKEYEWFFIESNYGSEEIQKRIAAKEAEGKFAYEHRVEHNHLSYEQAMDWLAANAGPESQYVLLHQHRTEKRSMK